MNNSNGSWEFPSIMYKNDIPVTRTSMPPFEEFIREIEDLWETHWITNMGPKDRLLKQKLEEYLKIPNISLFVNGHFALESAIEAFGFPSGGEIITTPFTFASTTHAIVRRGLVPVFCDINKNDYTIDTSKIEPLITDHTVAILPVHIYGNVCDVDSIDEIADAYDLKVIYDAAHAFGVAYKNRSVACFGDVTMFSFHATKVFHTIEGGALCYTDPLLKQKYDEIKDFGIKGVEEVVYPGANGKMNEFQAAMGICNLRHIDEEIASRKEVYNRYRERLYGVRGIHLVPEMSNIKSNYAYMPVLFDGIQYKRDKVMTMLGEYGIKCRKYFYPLTSDYPCYNMSKELPVAKKVSDNILTLPMFGNLSIADVDCICDLILEGE